MRAHLVQMDLAWEDRTENHARLRRILGEIPDLKGSGDLVVLPEMFDTGFSFRLEATVDRRERTLDVIREEAARWGITLQGSRTVLGSDRRGRNRATIAGPDGTILAEYDKIHPFTFGREAEFFTAGEEVVTYPWRSGSSTMFVCPAICYDLRFPELFRRGLTLGAEVFAVGANWPLPRKAHRRVLSIARAIENQAYMLSVNRAGKDPHLEYGGDSLAVSPTGDVLAESGAGEEVLSVTVDPEAVRSWRAKFPAWRDRRLG
jgi:omega-amidase